MLTFTFMPVINKNKNLILKNLVFYVAITVIILMLSTSQASHYYDDSFKPIVTNDVSTASVVNGLDVWQIGSFINYSVVIHFGYSPSYSNQNKTVTGSLQVDLRTVKEWPQYNYSILAFYGKSSNTDIQDFLLYGKADNFMISAKNNSMYSQLVKDLDPELDSHHLHNMYMNTDNFSSGATTGFTDEFKLGDGIALGNHTINSESSFSATVDEVNADIPVWNLNASNLKADYIGEHNYNFHDTLNQELKISKTNGVLLYEHDDYVSYVDTSYYLSTELEMTATSVSAVNVGAITQTSNSQDTNSSITTHSSATSTNDDNSNIGATSSTGSNLDFSSYFLFVLILMIPLRKKLRV